MKEVLKKCWFYFVFAGIFSLFINTLYLTFSLYMLAVYDNVLASYSMSTLWVITAIALAALIVLGLLDLLRSRLLVRAGVRIDEMLSRRVLKEMIRDLCRTDSLKYQDGLKDVNLLRNYLGGNSIFAFFDAPWIFIYLGIIFLVHPGLGFTAAAGGVVSLILGLLQNRLTRKDNVDAAKYQSRNQAFLAKSFRMAGAVRSMGMLTALSGVWGKTNDRETGHQERAGNRAQMLGAVSQSFSQMMQVFIYGAGAYLVLQGQVTAGVIIAASIIMGRALAPINQAIAAWRQTADAKDAYRRLTALLNREKAAPVVPEKKLEGHLKLENAGIAIGERQILKDISFELAPGTIMGLVGPNGAGKTSLCRLILGMWIPDQGQVLLDGVETGSLDQEAVGASIGYLPQAVELFPGSVAENIARMGNVDSERVVHAARVARAHEAILRFPSGYKTDVGEAGSQLSGGQRQRVGLARALYGNPSFVVLDEPNANLDEAGELALKQALSELKKKGTTVLMITHKPDLLYAADKILVLKNGEVDMFEDKHKVFERVSRA